MKTLVRLLGGRDAEVYGPDTSRNRLDAQKGMSCLDELFVIETSPEGGVIGLEDLTRRGE